MYLAALMHSPISTCMSVSRHGLFSPRRRLLATHSPHDSTRPPASSSSNPPSRSAAQPAARPKLVFDNKSTFKDFLAQQQQAKLADLDPASLTAHSIPYLAKPDGQKRKFYIEVYGCQMNTNDSELLNAILHSSGFERTLDLAHSDIVFLMTCAIRDNAEQKIWSRLRQLKSMRTKHGIAPQIGVLGCMAERLRDKLLDQEKLVDVVCGPDAYRSLPTLLALAQESRQVANVMLSADETYADIMPLRLDPDNISAHLSIMRGCNNMCAFCIVPFTRGTERSRPITSIVDEVRRLSDQGIREVTLLGQNVNSYRDTSSASSTDIGASLAPGFSTIYKRHRAVCGLPNCSTACGRRPRTPHSLHVTAPKRFPDDLLHVIKAHANIANQIHMPAQSGSTSMLARMRRGYSRDAYMALVDRMRAILPNVALSTDIIAGFCDETEAEHADTVSLMRQVGYDQAFMFAYSMREKTHAHRKYVDNVPDEVKHKRLAEIIEAHFETAKAKHQRELVGGEQLVLVEGLSRRGSAEAEQKGRRQWAGRAENNLKVHFELPAEVEGVKGKYVRVKIDKATGASLSGEYLGETTVREFYGVKRAPRGLHISALESSASSPDQYVAV
ncbi:hypothetical protein BCR44DRAFT_1438582 [Catenaria anguillulae PL171]|uniref:Uncharacterized protein n=1 Tax=Catenaria anguillulae PL171 TaxID=765915 RepID=A0A1Y2HH71_9FUNG|nr:hypothetical protein BCR44DRAFT_1438582 [Catenaria anguillulae PL171]